MKYIPFFLLIFISFACQKEQISIGTNVHDNFFVQNKGVSMPIDVFGNTASKVILVFVPGGPGLSGVNYRTAALTKIEEKYGVAYIDSRACGTSQGNSTEKLTAALMTEDLVLMLKTLKQRYGQDVSLFLTGHSFGAKLITDFITTGNNQTLIKGWINVSGWTIDEVKNRSFIRDQFLKFGNQEIAAGKNVDKWKPIVDICKANPTTITEEAFRTLPNFGAAEDLVADYIQNMSAGTDFFGSFITPLNANNKPVSALIGNYLGISTVNRYLYEELAAKDYHPLFKNVQIPIRFFVGKYDFLSTEAMMKDAFDKTSSVEKKMIIFQNSGHQIMSNEPDVFAKEMTDFMTKFK
jgi:pimeloyl-ACP methyl ester carboxylesterase